MGIAYLRNRTILKRFITFEFKKFKTYRIIICTWLYNEIRKNIHLWYLWSACALLIYETVKAFFFKERRTRTRRKSRKVINFNWSQLLYQTWIFLNNFRLFWIYEFTVQRKRDRESERERERERARERERKNRTINKYVETLHYSLDLYTLIHRNAYDTILTRKFKFFSFLIENKKYLNVKYSIRFWWEIFVIYICIVLYRMSYNDHIFKTKKHYL